MGIRSNTPDGYQITGSDNNGTLIVPSGRTVNLPNPAGNASFIVTIKRTGTGSPVLVAAASGLIDGAASPFSISVQNQVRTFETDGTDWWIVGGFS